MADGGEIRVGVTLDSSDAESKARNLSNELKKVGDAGTRSSGGIDTMKVAMGNLVADGIERAADACMSFVGDSISVGSGFETSMSKVAALSGASGDTLQALSDKAREMGASTNFSASEAADALGYMALAGWDAQQSMEGIDGVLKLAQAGEMDLAQASDLVTDYLSAFNMEASQTGEMVDVLSYAQANANTTVEGLGMAFKNCAANANAAGLDVQTTTAAISMMANQGLKGSEAGTALNAVMRDMTSQMKDGAISIGDAKVQIMDAQGNYRDFAAIIADVESATNGMGAAEKSAALQSTFTADSIKGLNLILNAGSGELEGFRDELYGCDGAASDMAATMTDNLQGDLASMNSQLEETQIQLYNGLEQPLRSIVQFVTSSVLPAAQWCIQNMPTIAVAIGAVAAMMAYLARETIAATVATNAHRVATLAQAAAQAVQNAVMAANPIALVVIAIAGLIAILVTAYNTSEDFRNTVDAAFQAISGVVSGAMAAAKGAVDGAMNGIKAAFDALNAIRSNVSAVFGGIKSAMSDPIGTAKKLISDAMGTIERIINGAKLSLPEIKLPHFNVYGGEIPWGLGGKGKAPSIDIDWYATGGYGFSSPALVGVGDAPDNEHILRDAHLDSIADRMARKVGSGNRTINVTVNARTGASATEIADEVVQALKLIDMTGE